jgi:hypothetical protein
MEEMFSVLSLPGLYNEDCDAKIQLEKNLVVSHKGLGGKLALKRSNREET